MMHKAVTNAYIMSTIFQKIIDREIPGQFLYEDERCVVILDAFPTVKGQCLVIPREPIEYAFSLNDDLYLHLCAVAKKMAIILDRVFDTEKTCLVIEGFDVPHTHLKLYPMTKADKPLGERMKMGQKATDDELHVIATQIIAAIED